MPGPYSRFPAKQFVHESFPEVEQVKVFADQVFI